MDTTVAEQRSLRSWYNNKSRIGKVILSPWYWRLGWQLLPWLGVCTVFFGVILFHEIKNAPWSYRTIFARIPSAVVTMGWMSNAIVILANGGVMPVIGYTGSFTSVWVQANSSHVLLWLCDWIPTPIGQASIGDMLLLAGLILWLLFLPPSFVLARLRGESTRQWWKEAY